MALRQCGGGCGKMLLARYQFCGDPCLSVPDEDDDVDVDLTDLVETQTDADDEVLDFGEES